MSEQNNCNSLNYDPSLKSSDSIIWNGDDVDCLGICKGQVITPLINAIALKVCKLIEDTDIEDVSLCPSLISALGVNDKTIANLLQILADKTCTLEELVNEISTTNVNSSILALDLKCLIDYDPCETTNYTLSVILQLMVNAICENVTNLANYQSDLLGIINSVVDQKLVTINQTITSIELPIGTILGFWGSLSGNFDSSGLGVPGTAYQKFALCNGQNGTQDFRGFLLPMVTTVASSVSLDSIITNAGLNYGLGTKGGRITVKLNANNLPPHTHSATTTVYENPQNKHSHPFNEMNWDTGPGTKIRTHPSAGMDTPYQSWVTDRWGISRDGLHDIDLIANTSVSVNNTNHTSFDIRNPFKAIIYIQKIA